MTSFIVSGRDKQKRITFAKEFCAKQQINSFDISLIEKDSSVKQTTLSIGIDDIKKIQKTIFLKPFKSKFKAIIIEDAHLLTIEAQNALLKVLEEPPAHTIMILGADRKEALLPTILSRCQLIELEQENMKLTPKEQKDITEFIAALPTLAIGERLKKAESLAKDKDKAIVWIEKVIVEMREVLLSTVILVNEVHLFEPEPQSRRPESQNVTAVRDSGQARMTNNLKALQSLHTLLKSTNVNPRFAIEDTLLNLSS